MHNQSSSSNHWIAAALARYPLIARVFDLARAHETPISLVGGTVRDLLSNAETHDLDFAVDGDGLGFARRVADVLGGAYVALDRERRTGRVLLTTPPETAPPGPLGPAGAPPENPPPSRGFCLDFASLRGPDLTADLRDRDFTINAMALVQRTGGDWCFLDPLNGAEDLRNGVLRAVSPSSFSDDPIRTLRAIRMRTQFGHIIAPQTRSWLRAAVPLLGRVSAERVRDEWFKILSLSGAPNALRELHQLELLREIAAPLYVSGEPLLTEVGQTDLLAHAFETVKAVERLWAAFQAAGPGSSTFIHGLLYALAPQIRQRYRARICDERTYLQLLKCAALLHDLGKVAARTTAAGHEQTGAEIAYRLGRTWRCSNAETELLRTVVRALPHAARLATQPPLTRRAIYHFFRQTGEYGIDAAIASLAHSLATQGPRLSTGNWERQAETTAGLLRTYYECRETVIEPRPLLSGGDLLRLFNLPPGPGIGELLRRLQEEQAAGQILTRDEAMVSVRQWLTA